MVILYNKQGIAVDVPDNAVDDALKNGFTREFAALSVLIKNYNPDVDQSDTPVDIQGSLKQVEFILQNRSDSVINVRYGEFGSETIILGGIPARSRLRFTAFSGTTQTTELPTANLTCSDIDNFVELGSPVTFTATQVVTGTITKVEFYSGSKLIGTSTTAPYTQSGVFTATGTYRVYARVYSGTEYTTTNSIQIFAIPNKRQERNLLPVVTLEAPSTGIINQAITLTATASDPDGTVNKVEFYINNQKIAEDLTAPYTTTFTPVENNNYQLKARAIDNLGAFADSSIITFVVAVPLPTVSVSVPKAGKTTEAQTLAATASVTGDTIASVQFQVNGANQGSPDTSSPYSTSWTPSIKGTYTIRAVATGALGGSTTSTVVNVPIYDTKVAGGGSGAGTSLGAIAQDYILFDNNQSAGGNAATMNVFVSSTQVAAFNYGDTAYNGKSFAYFNSANSTLYTTMSNGSPAVIGATVNF